MAGIGIMGGTFDPVHCGHLSLAEDAFRQVPLDQILFIPAKRSPFKLSRDMASEEDRVAMLRAAAAEMGDCYRVSSIEIKREGVSYTYETLRALRREYAAEGKEDPLYFITGTDTYLNLELWRKSAEILSTTVFIVGQRPGYEDERLAEKIQYFRKTYGTRTLVIDNRELDISSTEIRQRIRAREPLAGMVPKSVEQYIYEHGLYRTTEAED